MGFIVRAAKSVVKAVGSVIGSVVKVVGGIFGFSVGSKGDEAKAPNTLTKQIDPEAPRKIIFGKVAAPLDLRYWEVWGATSKNYDEVIAHAGHRINAILELYVDDQLAIDASGNPVGNFVGVLTRQTRLGFDTQTGINVGGGAQWTAAACPFSSVAYSVLKWVPDEKKLPKGIPSRYTQIVEGMPVYDPRRDSTVAGGSGSHRINDQTTWSYSTLDGNGQPIGRNNALQALAYLIGWTVAVKDGTGTATGERYLTCGRGVLPEDINLSTFIAGANNCEIAGYYTDLVLSTEDDHVSNENTITASGLIGRLIDPGGLWSYYANVDDTANIAVELTDADVADNSAVNWDEYKGMSEQFTQVAGKFINPSSSVLYQPYPYPMIRDATYETNLGRKVRKTIDFRQVLDGVLAQRLARLELNSGQYQGEFKAPFNYRALGAQAYSVVRYTSERFGWTKLFRVWRQEISDSDGVQMLLKEIHSSIWSAGTVTYPPAAAAAGKYDPRTEYTVAGFAAAQLPETGPDNTKFDNIRLTWTTPPNEVRRTEIRYKLNGTSFWVTGGLFERDVVSTVLRGLFSAAIYDIQARHISVNEIPGPWVDAGPFQAGSTGNVNLAAITAAGGTAVWANVTGPGKPENNADVTGTHQAATIANQGYGATATEDQVANNNVTSGMVRIARPVGGELANQTSPTGAILIRLPTANGQSHMLKFTVDIYEYDTNAAQTYEIGGYAYWPTGEWVNISARLVGGSGKARPVYFGKDGAGFYIAIGDGSGTWSYPAISIKNVQVSYTGSGAPTIAHWASGWSILFDPSNFAATSLPRISNPVAGDTYFGLNAFETWGGSVATIPNFKTNQGQAASIANQGYFATQNYADYTSRISNLPGAIQPENMLVSGQRLNANWMLYTADNNSVEYFKPATTQSDKTGNAQAATIANQGGLATKTGIRFGSLADNYWNPIVDENNSFYITNANSVTAYGQAASIANQGAFATLNSAAYGSTYLTGFGPVAQHNALFFGAPGGDARRGMLVDENNSFYITNANAVTAYGQAATIANQAPAATDSTIESSADVTKVANGPATGFLNYDSGGNLTSTMPKQFGGFYLTPAGSTTPYSSGVTWAVSIVSGSFVGAAPSASTTSGQGFLQLNSGITGADVVLAMTPTYNGKVYPPHFVKIGRNTAAAPTGGGSGGGATTFATGAISNSLTSTSFIVVSAQNLTMTVGSNGNVQFAFDADLSNYQSFTRTVTFKYQRETSPGSGSWVDVDGASASAGAPSINSGDTGFIALTVTVGSQPTGTQNYRIVGNLNGTGQVDVSGGCSIAQG